MKNLSFVKKIGKIIIKNRMLRTLGLLCVIFILFNILFVSTYFSYQNKIEENEIQIAMAQETLANLQYLATTNENEEVTSDLFKTKSFVGYEEVIPFIAMLESLFSVIDPKAEITIKSQEEQIFIDHFADYSVNLKISNNKELFFKAIEELYNSRFITRLNNFVIQYKPTADGNINELKEIEFTIRLFLK